MMEESDGGSWSMKRGSKNEEIWEFSREFKTYTYLILFLLGKLHFYPSNFSNFQIKSLNFQFNQFSPYLPNISLTTYSTWKFKFTLNINLPFYLSKSSNFYYRTMVQKFTDITGLVKLEHSIKKSFFWNFLSTPHFLSPLTR